MRHFCALAACVLVVALSGCTSSDERTTDRVVGKTSPSPSPSAVVVTESQLLGRWGADPRTAQERHLPSLRFDADGRMAGFDGCNEVSGTWKLDPGTRTVRVDKHLASLVACPKLEQARLETLTFDGTTLTYILPSGKTKTMTAAKKKNLVVMFPIGVKSGRLEVVPAPLHPGTSSRTPEARAVAGVKALMAVEEDKGAKYSNLWGKPCGLGTGVRSVESLTAEPVIEVTLTGQGGGLFDLTIRGSVLRSQQLAWTVVKNLGVKESTPVRVLGPDGSAVLDDVVPDRTYLAAPAG